MTPALACATAPRPVTRAVPRPRSNRADARHPRAVIARARSTSAPDDAIGRDVVPDTASSEIVEGIVVDEDRDESLVRISGNVRASRRGVLGGLGGVGAALGLTSSTSAIVGPGAAEAAAAPASSPAPIAEIAAASSRATSASTASSIVGYSNLHDPRVFNGLATPDRTNRSLDGLIPAGEAPPDVEVARAAAALEACDTPMQKYRQLVSLQNTDETTFYALLESKTAELLPVLYLSLIHI